MPSSVLLSASSAPRKRLESVDPRMAKADLKKLEADWKQALGRAIARCFSLAGLSQKEAAALLDKDPAQVARWIAATEPPQIAALFGVAALRGPLVQALAELADLDVTTEIRIRRRA